MAKKTPKKFRQARKDAKAEAKKAFPGKRKAVVKDRTVKYSAEDKKILREIQQEAKRGYITTDTGERVYSKPTETAQERIARDRAAAKAEALRKYPLDDDKKPKKKPAKKAKLNASAAEKKAAAQGKAAAAKNKPQVKEAVAEAKAKKYPNAKPIGTISFKDGKMSFKPAEGFKKGEKLAPTKSGMTRAEKSAANKAAWAKMSPAERKNWKATRPGANPTAATPKTAPVQSVTNVQPEKAGKGTTKPRFVQKKTKAGVAKTTTAAPKTGGTVAVRPKGTVVTTGSKPKPKAVAAGAAKKTSKLAKFGRRFAVGAAAAALGAEAVSIAKGSVTKDMKEINRLEEKLAKLQGKKSANATVGGRFNSSRKLMQSNLSNLADLATFGAVGKTRRERMDELNKLIRREKKKTKTTSGSAFGSSSAAERGRTAVRAGRDRTKSASSGSSDSKPSGVYVVKRGDTLSGIAKAAGVSLADVRAANKKFAKNPKYKQGSMIWAGTTVKIPKKK